MYVLKRGGGGEKERERSISVQEKHYQSEIKPATQACTLTRNRTGDFDLPDNAHSPSHIGQGWSNLYFVHVDEEGKTRGLLKGTWRG